jgi:hypothetical protein
MKIMTITIVLVYKLDFKILLKKAVKSVKVIYWRDVDREKTSAHPHPRKDLLLRLAVAREIEMGMYVTMVLL